MAGLNRKTFMFLARILPASLCFLACTTAQSHSRLRLQRQGIQPNWQNIPWRSVESPWFGAGFPGSTALAERVQSRLNQDLKAHELPEKKPLHLVLGRPRIDCERTQKRWRCYAQVIVEMRGRRGKMALWAAEGLAWLELDHRPRPEGQLPMALSLVRTAIQSIREGPQVRPTASGAGPLALAIRDGKVDQLDDWFEELDGDRSTEARRIALWLAIGHLADKRHRPRIEIMKARSVRETKARQLALDWLDEIPDPGR